jgi:3-methyladenine DNA glycosylase AlkD
VDEIAKLMGSPFHEHRLIGLLILVDQHKRGDEEKKAELHRFYLEHLAGVNNWDLVDTSAAALVGEHLGDDPKLLKRLAVSGNIWERRIAMVSTFAELRAGRTKLTFKVAEMLLDDRHDLIHKAVGWLLREAGKVSHEALLAFLRKHYARLPRTTLRYAIERLDPVDRKLWLSGPQ